MRDELSNGLTSSSAGDPFPLVTRTQLSTISRVIHALPPGASSWSSLTEAYQGLDIDESEYYSLFLKLSLTVGPDWRAKWSSARASLDERGVGVGDGPGAGGGGGKSRRAGGLDVLRARLDAVPPVPRGATTTSTTTAPARPPSTPPALDHIPRHMPSRTPRPKSTAFESTAPLRSAGRDFLVESQHGMSSSDDYVGVPTRPRSARTEPKSLQPVTHAPLTPVLSKRASAPPPPRTLPPSHAAPRPAKSALSTRRPISTASPSAPINSVALPTEHEVMADRFRRFSILKLAWVRWRELRHYMVVREAHTDRLVRLHLLRCHLYTWIERTVERQRLEQLAESIDLVRVAREKARLFVSWERKVETRIKERRHREREARLREANIAVQSRHATTLARVVLEHWHESMLTSRAHRFHRETLTGLALVRWKSKHARVVAMDRAAEDLILGRNLALVQSALQRWWRNASLLGRERSLAERYDSDVRRNWWLLWKKQTKLHIQRRLLRDRADQFKDGSRLRNAFNALSSRCDAVVAAKELALLSKTLNYWAAEYCGADQARGLDLRLVHRAFATWKRRFEVVTVDLQERAATMHAAASARLLMSAFDQWEAAAAHRHRLGLYADTVAQTSLARRTLGEWRDALAASRTLEAQGDVAVRYFRMQRVWNAWSRKMDDRRQAAWKRTREVKLMRDVLHRWLNSLRKAKADQALVESFQQSIDERVLRESVRGWGLRIVALRDREVQADRIYETGLARCTLDNWKDAILRHEESYSLLESVLFVRDQKLLRSAFRNWLKESRKAVEIERRMKQFLEDKRRATLETVFDKWRELSLRQKEKDLVVIRKRRVRESAWVVWRGRTKMLPAIHFDRMKTLSRALDVWRIQVPDPTLVAQAAAADRSRTLERGFDIWRIKFNAKIALHRVRGFGAHSFAPAPFIKGIHSRTSPALVSLAPQLEPPTPATSRPLLTPRFSSTPPALGPTPFRSRLSGDASTTQSSRSSGSVDGSEDHAAHGGGTRARLRAAAAAGRRRSVHEG